MFQNLRIRNKMLSILLIFFGISATAVAALDPGEAQSVLPKMYKLDQMEMQAGRLGYSRACRGDVQQFSRMLERDHRAHAAQVVEMARIQRVDLDRVEASQWEASNIARLRQAMARVMSIRDCTFDVEYLKVMRDAHAFAIQAARRSMTARNSGEIRRFIQTTLVSLRRHYATANQLLKRSNRTEFEQPQ
jgi:predicted outer membrane protein